MQGPVGARVVREKSRFWTGNKTRSVTLKRAFWCGLCIYIRTVGTLAARKNRPAMSVASLAAFARMHASHEAFLASCKTSQRPAALVEAKAADVAYMAAMPGSTVLVKVEWEKGGVAPGKVSMAFENGDVRMEHGVNTWGSSARAATR